MRIVRPALDCDVDSCSRGISLLRVETACLDLEFLHGISRWREAYRTVKGIIRRAVESDLVLGRRSVRSERGQIAIGDRSSEHRVARVSDARRECSQLVC